MGGGAPALRPVIVPAPVVICGICKAGGFAATTSVS
jgi:hypothetical protein